MLVDNGSFVNILFGATFDKMILDYKLTPTTTPLYRFIEDIITSSGRITLAVEMGQQSQTNMNFMEFLIVDSKSAYHGVLGRSALKDLGADPTKILKVGKGLSTKIKEKLKDFLSRNLDILAWRHDDMVDINPKVSYHHLKIDPKAALHRQKRRALNPKRYEALKEEVFNLELIKKHNEKWRVYIDFTNRNKACPKNRFSLTRIDQLIDSTAGHELLSSMDAYSSYNKIFMFLVDEKSTSFITDRGLYCYKMIPLGLKNVGATY
ncbi:uncharacterized protein LOC111404618 [Olea europaea var. sylvestris]|uniref:uncharacterized protein LOC111404618 n=1 Tax=Olea europaea var. sylvestris TaxID=158386 RepID=UPI000C1CE60F|nr:uncharacterized protein LOC111404618 [Olea europaea var. sylvestris]